MLTEEYFMKNGIEVLINDMKKGDILFSRDYSICNALIFVDTDIAALAHISNATSPKMLLDGYVSNLLNDPKEKYRRIESMQKIFKNLADIAAYHVCRTNSCWKDAEVIEVLRDTGIKKIYSKIITDPAFRTRDIGVSMIENNIYIFPKSYSEKEKNPIIIPIPYYKEMCNAKKLHLNN